MERINVPANNSITPDCVINCAIRDCFSLCSTFCALRTCDIKGCSLCMVY